MHRNRHEVPQLLGTVPLCTFKIHFFRGILQVNYNIGCISEVILSYQVLYLL